MSATSPLGYGPYVRPASSRSSSNERRQSTSSHIRRRSSSASFRAFALSQDPPTGFVAHLFSTSNGGLYLAQSAQQGPSYSHTPYTANAVVGTSRRASSATASTCLTSWTDLEKGLESSSQAPPLASRSTVQTPPSHRPSVQRACSSTRLLLATFATPYTRSSTPEQIDNTSKASPPHAYTSYCGAPPLESRDSNNRQYHPSGLHPQSIDEKRNSSSNLSQAGATAPELSKDAPTFMPSIFKSTPIRLLAYAILFFNFLIVAKVLAYDSYYDPGWPDIMVGYTPGVGQMRFVDDNMNDIQVVRACSHNDEMQAAPFSEAMSLGFSTIEVDVHLVDNVLLAGHELQDLASHKTLKSIYLDPLYKMLERANAGQSGSQTENQSTDSWKGIFPSAPKQDLMLMIDVKMDPEATFEALVEAIKPFIARNWLTVYRDGKLIPGPLTIVGTGSTPVELVYRSSPRFVFIDAPLVRLEHPIAIDGETVEWGPELAPLASSKWLWWNYFPNMTALRRFSDEAHKRGIKARWWGVARWPVYFRRALWNLQLKAGVDIINADDLADVANFLRSRKEAGIVAEGPETPLPESDNAPDDKGQQ